MDCYGQIRKIPDSSIQRFGSGLNPMRGGCQLLNEGCVFTPRIDQFLQLWKLNAIYNQIRLKNGVKQ